ncbi:type VI secretion system baseplate subunit TssK [Enterobacter hormaechei]
MRTEQPLWGRGQMVSPQHFQQQAAYAAWSAECIARLGLSHPWGVINATFESDVLKLGRLQARHLHLRFPDGTLIDTDNADDLPPVLALESETQDVVVVLALPLLRANGGNCLKPDEVAARPVRYRQRWRDVRNLFGDDTRQIAVMRPELTLRFAHQNNSDYLTCPVARLQQDSQGNWALDETYLPPLLALLGSRWLMTQLEQLLTQLRARLGRLMDMRRESNERMADFAVADVSLFWLLNALNSAEPVLGQFQRHPQSPPERLYPELARLAGSLLTFSLEHQVSAIPAWQHEQLNNVFPPLFDLLGDLLEASLPSRVVAIELEHDDRLHFWQMTEIISLIDGIAFQTNILALNAAVEAARAGDHGKGFSVVAGEVRSLAHRSAEAAKNIKSLIEVTSHNVTQGVNVVSEAEKNMHDIVTGSGNVSRLMDEISASTSEQEKGISQITQALSELERVTQSNVSMVEELNGSSDVLRNQVIELQTRTRNFRLENELQADNALRSREWAVNS